MTGFTAILTETLPAGLLPLMAHGLNVSEALAGQSVTAYAVGTLIAAIPLTAWTQAQRRKPTLLAAIAGFLLFNTITAVSANFWMTLGARFFAGVASGLAWGILAGYARRMVTGRLKGRALAVAMVGTPIALSLGVPVGTFLGAALGWRAAFLAMSATTIVLILWVMWKVPDFPGQASHQRMSIHAVFATPGIRPILAVIFAWMTAHNILYTYIAPFARLAGLQARVDLLLLGFGLSALAGIWVTGVLVDRMLRRLALVSLIGFVVVALALSLFPTNPVVTIAGVLVWGLSFGGAATQLQTASADAAGNGVDLANAMITTVWNGAIAAGGIVGGLLLEHAGANSFPWAVLALSAVAFCIASIARGHAFKPGPRSHA
ncbi:MFS transporter [Lichenicola cladoniae]|uniref:MFS transporter n=2 Tax=Lichenicola cladoniae TaxID=1484109 RepID=A0A6M8HWT3_9PROT|nr:MFS transporter [Acetobacteraceae bacterium]QKE92521.1 MFS transporter [Lichenicola cladoniae]